MGFRLSWQDVNVSEEEHNIYRSQSPMDPEALPAPLATVGPNVTSYEDGDVVAGEVYYYRVSALGGSGAVEAVSDEIMVEASQNQVDITTLFSSGEVGGVYDISDLSSLFQDTGGTVPVTADGDPVGLVLDKSGLGNNMLQATSARRPTYRTNGSEHWLDFNVTACHLTFGNHAIQNLVSVLGYDPLTDTSGLFYSNGKPLGSTAFFHCHTSGSTTDPHGSGASLLSYHKNGVLIDPGPSTRGAIHTQLQGKNITTWQTTATAIIDSTNWVFGSFRPGDSSVAEFDIKGRLYGLIWRDALFSSAERDISEQYLAGIMGITLG